LDGISKGKTYTQMADNIRIHLREIRWEFVDWIHLAEDRNQWQALVNMVMNFGFHKRRAVS
jgi:hypothetical protein